MTIAFDVSYIQRSRAGYGRLSMELLRGLLARDRSNRYILHGWSAALDETAIRSFTQPNVTVSIARIPGPIKRFYWNQLHRPSLQTIIGPFDIFHGAEPMLPPVGQARAIATLHDLSYRKHPEFFTRDILRWDGYVMRSLDEARVIIVPSESTRKDLLELARFSPDKIHVIYPPPNPLFSVGNKEKKASISSKFALPEQYILFVGTMEPRKNIPGLVHAYELLREIMPDAPPLVIIGKKGWLAENSVTAIQRSRVRTHIILPGYCSDEELAGIYHSSSLFVFPSFYEGFGSPVREAMASGVPVITSANSSLQEIGRDAAVLIDPSQPQQIAEAMKALLTDSRHAAQVAQRGLQRAAELAASDSIARVLQIYENLRS